MGVEETLALVRGGAGTHFDPAAAAALLALHGEPPPASWPASADAHALTPALACES
jgi:hypothetical protein